MKKQIALSLLCFIFSSLVAFGQVRFFVQAGANYTMIPNVEQTDGTWYTDNTLSERFDNKPGFFISGGLEKKIGAGLSLHAGLGLLNLNYTRIKKTETYAGGYAAGFYQGDIIYGGIRPGSPFGSIQSTPIGNLPGVYSLNPGTDYRVYDYYPDVSRSRTNLYYVSLPVGIDYQLFKDHFRIGLGITPAILAGSVQQKSYYAVADQGGKNTTSDGLGIIQFSGSVNASLRLSRCFWASVAFHQGFTPIYDKDYRYAGKARLRYLEAGLGYVFAGKKK